MFRWFGLGQFSSTFFIVEHFHSSGYFAATGDQERLPGGFPGGPNTLQYVANAPLRQIYLQRSAAKGMTRHDRLARFAFPTEIIVTDCVSDFRASISHRNWQFMACELQSHRTPNHINPD